ncbi:triacylglycerol lipase [Ostertagia ostertagi]
MLSLLVVSLVVSAGAAPKYSDSMARNFMLPLSAAAYSDDPQQCLTRLFPNATVYRQRTVQCDAFKKDTCSGFTAVLHPQKAIVMSFRGTTRFLQLLQEITKTVFVNLQNMERWYECTDFFELRSSYPDYEIWITGHSLGGSIASLAASFLVGSRAVNSSQVKLITFGQPRTGDIHFSTTHDDQLEYSFRVTHWRDIVPHIPLGPIGGYFHHRQEAFYKNKMDPSEVTICESRVFLI